MGVDKPSKTVTLFNIVASRFWTPGSLELDTPPSAVQAPSSSPVYYAPVSSVASPSRVPTVIPAQEGHPEA
ncbi:hypothetical protein MRX96_036745 [Rhipicephalus microplus]